MIVDFINAEQDEWFHEIVFCWDDYLMAQFTVSTVANQTNYTIPEIAMVIRRVAIRETSTEEYRQVRVKRSLNDINKGWYLSGRDIVLDPAPTYSIVNGLRVDYTRIIPRMNTGTVQEATVNTITLETSADVRDDYYNSVFIQITDGTGSGQRRLISDYAGSTRIATVSQDWTTIPDATSVYATVSILPDYIEDCLCLGGAKRALATVKEPNMELNELYRQQKINAFNVLFDRRQQVPHGVRPTEINFDEVWV